MSFEDQQLNQFNSEPPPAGKFKRNYKMERARKADPFEIESPLQRFQKAHHANVYLPEPRQIVPDPSEALQIAFREARIHSDRYWGLLGEEAHESEIQAKGEIIP